MSNKLNCALFMILQALCFACVGVGVAITQIRQQIGLYPRLDLLILTILMDIVAMFSLGTTLYFYEKLLKEK